MSHQTTQDLSRLAARQVERMSDAAGKALDDAHDAADKALTSVKRNANDIADQAPGFVDLALDRVKMLGERGSQLARATGALAADKAKQAADHTAERIRQDPLKSMLIAVATGAAVALIASHVANRRNAGR